MAKQQKTEAIATAQPTIVYNNLVVKAANRNVLDIGAWRQALKAADKGKTKALFDLFEDVLLDGVLSDAIDKRIDAVLTSPLLFIDEDGEEVPEVMALLESLSWEDFLRQILLSRFWGRSAVELSFAEDKLGVYPIPAKHINLSEGLITYEAGGQEGYSYLNDPFLIVLGKERDFGLLLKAAPLAIYKRGGFGDWAQWIEIFGMPQRIGKYNAYDPQSRQLLEDAFERAGSASWLVVPGDTTIEHGETSSGNGVAYDDFRRACNEEMLITILGQTMTTTQGDKGARSLGEVHQEVEAAKHKSDLRYCQRILNEYLRPRLEARGYPVAGGRFVYPKEHQLPEVAEIVQLSDILDIPKAWLHEQYGIPMPSEGEDIARRAVQPMGLDFSAFPEDESLEEGEEGTDEGEETRADIKNSDKVGLWQRILRFFGVAPRHLALGVSAGSPLMTDIHLADVATINDRLIERVAEAKGKGTFDIELFEWISKDLLRAVERGLKGKGIANDGKVLETSYALQNDALITAMEINLYRFSAGKTLAEVQALNEAFRKSKSYEDFRKEASKIAGKFNDLWQRTEYDTALLAAESAANYSELRRKTRLFPYWKYKTIGDDKVRQEHQELNGLILPHDDPRWKEIFPPNGWGCRCRVEPVMAFEGAKVDAKAMQEQADRYMTSTDWKNAKASGWGVNKGERGEVFDNNQQYLYKLPGNSSRKLPELQYKDYGLETFDKAISKPDLPQIEAFEGDPDQWIKAHGVLTDHKGRKLILDEKNFKRHTTGKTYEKTRPKLLNALEETLSMPDEVWLNDYAGEFDNMCYIKYYQGKAIAVTCSVKEGKVYEVRTWFEIAGQGKKLPSKVVQEKGRRTTQAEKDPRGKYRRGLLIHKRKG